MPVHGHWQIAAPAAVDTGTQVVCPGLEVESHSSTLKKNEKHTIIVHQCQNNGADVRNGKEQEACFSFRVLTEPMGAMELWEESGSIILFMRFVILSPTLHVRRVLLHQACLP